MEINPKGDFGHAVAHIIHSFTKRQLKITLESSRVPIEIVSLLLLVPNELVLTASIFILGSSLEVIQLTQVLLRFLKIQQRRNLRFSVEDMV